jgi:3D (Asp-Asp-Asp) domain-containing protein
MSLRSFSFLLFVLFYSCKDDFEKNYTWHTIKVTATAYNSLKNQTDSNPHITAYGDSLKPGMKYVAVSNDLIKKGLRHNTPIKIKGLEGIYFVKDRMHARWQNRIDIYMGIDVEAAKKWGRKRILIDYGIPIK